MLCHCGWGFCNLASTYYMPGFVFEKPVQHSLTTIQLNEVGLLKLPPLCEMLCIKLAAPLWLCLQERPVDGLGDCRWLWKGSLIENVPPQCMQLAASIAFKQSEDSFKNICRDQLLSCIRIMIDPPLTAKFTGMGELLNATIWQLTL